MRVYFVNNVSMGFICCWGNEPYAPFCEFVINIWNKYVLTGSGGIIMLLVSKYKCELFEIMR